MSSTKLRRELLDDPLARDYAGMTDAAVLADITDDSTVAMPDLNFLSSAQIYDIIDRGEYDALDAAGQAEVALILGLSGPIDVSDGSQFRATMVALFPNGSTTRTAFLALVTNRTQARATELAITPSALTTAGVNACRLPDQPDGTE
jgi:hypothetical protein